jgi:hypothetical protein
MVVPSVDKTAQQYTAKLNRASQFAPIAIAKASWSSLFALCFSLFGLRFSFLSVLSRAERSGAEGPAVCSRGEHVSYLQHSQTVHHQTLQKDPLTNEYTWKRASSHRIGKDSFEGKQQ